MTRIISRLRSWSILLLSFSLLGSPLGRLQAAAQSEQDPPPNRSESIVVEVIHHVWWLSHWTDSRVRCEVVIQHENLPTRREILDDCGHALYQDWIATPNCEAQDPSQCDGLYLHHAGSSTATETIVVELPSPSAFLELEGCSAASRGEPCSSIPSLKIIGHEPLPNEEISSIRGTYAGNPFECAASSCSISLRPSSQQGHTLFFWANSSFGDSSEHYEAKIRVVSGPDQGWHVDVVSPQFRGEEPLSCAPIWSAFPPVGELPDWLRTPNEPADLATSRPYAQLAELLVDAGVVNATACGGLGFGPLGGLNGCGLDAAEPAVMAWQNRFDSDILQVSRARNVPPHVLKRIFGQESQFWPGFQNDDRTEAGLGQLTQEGADTALLWNEAFFQQFCPLVLSEQSCSLGYLELLPGEQALLRGALFADANADCPECELGVDMTIAKKSVGVFAETLRGHCAQVGRMIRNTTGAEAGDVLTYTDLWRMTVASYHGGPGCVASALEDQWRREGALTWEGFASYLPEGCAGVTDYVKAITGE